MSTKLPEHRTLTVGASETGERLDKALSLLLNAPRNQVQHMIQRGDVLVNGTVAGKAKQTVQEGDLITVIEDWNAPAYPEPEDLPISIVYENDRLLVIDKPAGQVVHPIAKEGRGTVVNALLHRYPAIKQAVYEPENPLSLLRPGIVHRLDKDTSGVLLVAKDRLTMEALAQQFQDHSVTKTYLALLKGEAEEQTISSTLRRVKHGNLSRMKADDEDGEGRTAVSHLVPDATFAYQGTPLTLATFTIETGRTHQIRAQARQIGHPVIGDELYGTAGSKRLSQALAVTRQLLHAYRLTFRDPHTGEEITCTAPLPQDYISILTKLEHT